MPSTPAIDREALTQEIGRQLLQRLRRQQGSLLSSGWWEERMLRLLMANEWLKVQAFRFVDALPMMTDDRDVARHLREYLVAPEHVAANGHAASAREQRAAALAELERSANGQLTRFVSHALNFERLDSPRAKMAAWAARTGATTMARRFIAGTTVKEAERAIRRLRGQRGAFTIDVLGEAAVSAREAEQYQRIYLDLIEGLAAHANSWTAVELVDGADGQAIPRVNVSVKLTALHPGFDPMAPERSKRIAKDRLRPLLRAAMQRGVHLHVDMEHYAIKTLTLETIRELFNEEEFRSYPHVGIVLQAYLRDCEQDARELIDWCRARGTPIWVRLVKGAYWDTESVMADQLGWPRPVWDQKWQSDACYERVTRLLCTNHQHIRTALGSHNIRSLAHGIALKRQLGIPAYAFETQVLFGMGDPIRQALTSLGERCRVYTPYGELLPGMAYFIRRLLENTANESFLRHAGSEETSDEVLLRDPVETGKQTPPHEAAPLIRFEFGEPLMDPFENEPDTDFTRADRRAALQAALPAVRRGLGKQHDLLIGGRAHKTAEYRTSTNPANPGETIGTIAVATTEHAEQAVNAAVAALAAWRATPVAERAALLERVATRLRDERKNWTALLILEAGKPWREADSEVSHAIDLLRFYASEMRRLHDYGRRRDVPGEVNEYFYAPRGVTAVLSPWNYPLSNPAGVIGAALVTGNTVVFKPSSLSGVVAARLAAAFVDAGAPDSVLNFLPGRGEEIGDLLVKHPRVATICFTGSRAVGWKIYGTAADAPTVPAGRKRVIAEMGGRNAIIVDSDADLDEAIKGVVDSAFGYGGQKGSACGRAIVLAPLYERFVERLVEATRGISVGPAEDSATKVPPLISQPAQAAVQQYIDIGLGEGRCALQVDVREAIEQHGGHYVGPAIFVDVAPDARIAQEEIFGPVLAVIAAPTFEDAVEIFNNSDYALAGGVYSRSPANLEHARQHCECGNLYINRKINDSRVDRQPYGGYRLSGVSSKVGGPDYLRQFCEPRTITENTLRRGFAPSEQVAEIVG